MNVFLLFLIICHIGIGLTIEEIAIIYLALPFTTFLSPPLTGNFDSLYCNVDACLLSEEKFPNPAKNEIKRKSSKSKCKQLN